MAVASTDALVIIALLAASIGSGTFAARLFMAASRTDPAKADTTTTPES